MKHVIIAVLALCLISSIVASSRASDTVTVATTSDWCAGIEGHFNPILVWFECDNEPPDSVHDARRLATGETGYITPWAADSFVKELGSLMVSDSPGGTVTVAVRRLGSRFSLWRLD